MNVKITPSGIFGEVVAPPSKSYAHRMLIAAYLAGEKVRVCNAGSSFDVLATLNALKSLGAEISTDGGVTTVERKAFPKVTTINCGESGSTLRFLLPVVAALGIRAAFTGEGRLLSRPISELVRSLNLRGADIDGLTVGGKLCAGEFRIPAFVSSQYVTGLLFALPLLSGDSTIVLEGESVSTGYLDITLDVLAKFGIQIQKTHYGYFVKGGQKYKANDVTVEGDYSGAAFILSLGALCGEVKVRGLNSRSLQGDAEILNIIEKFGAAVSLTDDCVTVKKGELHAIETDCENIPDLVQIISVLAAYSCGVTVLRGVNRLKLKESDRVQAIIDQLKTAGVRCDYESGNLYIRGGKPKGAVFSGGGDHRTAMSATVLGLNASGESTVVGAEAVHKSYTEFYGDIKKLGGRINVEI